MNINEKVIINDITYGIIYLKYNNFTNLKRIYKIIDGFESGFDFSTDVYFYNSFDTILKKENFNNGQNFLQELDNEKIIDKLYKNYQKKSIIDYPEIIINLYYELKDKISL